MKRLLRLLDDAWIGLPAALLFALLLSGPAHMIVQM